MENSENLLQGGPQVDAEAYTHLKEVARWAHLLAIVGFVISILILLAAFLWVRFSLQLLMASVLHFLVLALSPVYMPLSL